MNLLRRELKPSPSAFCLGRKTLCRAMGLWVAAALIPTALQATTPDLPTPEVLFQRHIEALGGADALRQAQSLSFKGMVSLPVLKTTAPIEFVFQTPDRFYCQFRFHYAFFGFLKVPFVGKRQAECGYDGRSGWMVNFERHVEPLNGTDEAFFRGLLDKFSPLCFHRRFRLARTLGVEQAGGHDYHRVLIVFPFGEHAFEFYDVKTGLLAATIYPFDDDGTLINVQTTYSDFRPVGKGLRLPFRLEPQVADQHYSIQAAEVRTDLPDVRVPASKFNSARPELPVLKPAETPAAEVIARYLQACGGAKAMRRHTSLHLKGKYEFPGAHGFTNQMEIFTAVTNRCCFTISTPTGLYREGCDGERYWRVDGKEIRFAAGRDLAQKLAGLQFQADLHPPEAFRSIETLGTISLDGHECYQLLLVRKNGEVFDEFYDMQTGLLRARRTTDERTGGALKLMATFTDYRRYGDLMLASHQSYKLNGDPQTVIITNAEWDTVPDAVFQMPPDVKAAWERQASAPAK